MVEGGSGPEDDQIYMGIEVYSALKKKKKAAAGQKNIQHGLSC